MLCHLDWLNADPLAQIIGTENVADIIMNDAEACALLDSRATAVYAQARKFYIRPITDLSDRFMNLNLAAGFRTIAAGYVKYNLQIPWIFLYDSDLVALVAKDHTEFGTEVPLTIGTKMEDTILKVLKEGEIEMLVFGKGLRTIDCCPSCVKRWHSNWL